MTTFARSLMIDELWNLTRPYVLKADDEARADRVRADEICRVLGVECPEDVLDSADAS